jgi:phage host-nuclease inhibitor protein Gam
MKYTRRNAVKLKLPKQQKELNPLIALEDAMADLRTFEHRHEMIFEEYRVLAEEIAVKTEEVKTWCKQNRTNLSTDRMVAEFSEGKSRWYDAHDVSRILQEHKVEVSTIDQVVLQEWTVDEKKLKQLAAFKNIDMSIFQPAYREEVTQIRCTIKEKEQS